MIGKRSPWIVVVVAVGGLVTGCSGSTGSGTPTQTPSPAWTFMTKQEFCPRPGWHGVSRWVAQPMITTVLEEAAIATEVGACASSTGGFTYLVNVGGTAWTIGTSAAVEHYYDREAPALLLPLREAGVAPEVLGPYERAFVEAGPTAISWNVDVPMTVAASTTGQMADQYGRDDFTADALKSWKKTATRKGSPNKLLAVCATNAYDMAQLKWTSTHDVQSVVQDVTAGLATGRNAAGCLGAITEFDEGRVERGLEPRVSPLLRSGTFEVTGQRFSYVEKAAKLLGAVLKARG